MPRHYYNCLFRKLFSARLQQYRGKSHLTQEEMAERLRIAPRSYVDLEHGKYSCSGLTVILFLLQLEDSEAIQLIHSTGEQLEEADFL